MRSVPLWFFFGLALIPAVFGSILFPYFHLSPFAPFFAVVFYLAPFSKALWISGGCGIILDLLSSEFHFGVHALSLVATTFLLYHQKKHFFEEKSVAFAMFTSVISSISTLLQLLLAPLFDRGVSFSLISFMTDAVALPLVDGLYGFLWFTCPMRLYIYIKKKGWKALFRKPQNEEQ